MPVRRVREQDQNLTRLIVSGHIVEEEMYEALEEFYAEAPTKLLMWDLSFAEVWHITPDMIYGFVRRAAKLSVKRPGGRTAVVAPGDPQFDVGNLSKTMFSIGPTDVELRVFHSEAEALSWLTDEKESAA